MSNFSDRLETNYQPTAWSEDIYLAVGADVNILFDVTDIVSNLTMVVEVRATKDSEQTLYQLAIEPDNSKASSSKDQSLALFGHTSVWLVWDALIGGKKYRVKEGYIPVLSVGTGELPIMTTVANIDIAITELEALLNGSNQVIVDAQQATIAFRDEASGSADDAAQSAIDAQTVATDLGDFDAALVQVDSAIATTAASASDANDSAIAAQQAANTSLQIVASQNALLSSLRLEVGPLEIFGQSYTTVSDAYNYALTVVVSGGDLTIDMDIDYVSVEPATLNIDLDRLAVTIRRDNSIGVGTSGISFGAVRSLRATGSSRFEMRGVIVSGQTSIQGTSNYILTECQFDSDSTTTAVLRIGSSIGSIRDTVINGLYQMISITGGYCDQAGFLTLNRTSPPFVLETYGISASQDATVNLSGTVESIGSSSISPLSIVEENSTIIFVNDFISDGDDGFLQQLNTLSSDGSAIYLPVVDNGWISVGTTEVPFLNGWTNFNPTSRTVRFKRDGDTLSFRGLSAGGSTLTSDQFTLPDDLGGVSYRPDEDREFYARSADGSSTVTVRSSGAVVVTGGGSNVFNSIEGSIQL